jgi:penicillin amidase
MLRFSRITAGLVAVLTVLAVSVAGRADAAGRSGFRILRDSYGVPRVYARSAHDLFFGEGYAQAQDRLWQADLVRRTATGTLSALIGAGNGDGNVQADTFWRLYTGGQSGLHDQVLALDPATRTAVEAFAAGFNAWIARAGSSGALPLEYASVQQTPLRWTAEDVVAASMLSIMQVGTTGADELANAGVLADLTTRLGPAAADAAFADSHWSQDPSAPTTIGGTRPVTTARVTGPKNSAAADMPAPAEALLRAAHASMHRLGLDSIGHSNAIALSGRLTRSGHPLLMGGPQIGYSLPQGFLEVGLHGAGYDVTGVVLAGTPGVQIGVGNNFSWTVTSGGDDNQDWYVEQLDPAAHPGQYFFRDSWRSLDCHRQSIAVAGAPAVAIDACESVHGPVLGQQGSAAYTLRDATRGRVSDTLRGFLGIDRARTLAEFLSAGRGIAASLNLTYADTAGHIAYAHVGPVPVRAVGDNPFLPHPGDGSDEWRGLLPRSAMPLVVDPPQGWLANWNNKPRADWSNSSDGFWQWGPVQRVQVIQRQLNRMAPHTATMATLEQIVRTTGQTAETPAGDDSAVVVQALLPRLLGAVGASRDPDLNAALQTLRTWDQSRIDANGDGTYDDPALTIFAAWYTQLVDATVVPVLGDPYRVGGSDENTTANIVDRILSGPHAALALNTDYLNGRPVRAVVVNALRDALADLSIRFATTDQSRWLTPDVAINWAPLGAGTVADTPWMNRGTYNQIVALDPGALHGENVVAPGQSGDPRSPHFADQLQLYATWTYKRMSL